MLKQFISLLLFFLSSLCFSFPCLAQVKEPKGFFEDNYVGKITEKEKGNNNTPQQFEYPNSKQATPSQSIESKAALPLLAKETATPQPEATFSEDELKKALRIDQINLIVSPLDSQHLDHILGEAVSLSYDYKLPLGRIIVVGAFYEPLLNMSHIYALQLRGVSLEDMAELPQKYPVKKSPTWIIVTEKGEVLLEGIDSIKGMISKDSKLVLRQ
jgi:hypothetical protein